MPRAARRCADIVYDGVLGPLEFICAVEPSTVPNLILEFDEIGRIVVAGSI